MAKKHEEYLKYLFDSECKIFTGSELVKKICENFSECTQVNARKIIQNSVAKGIMKSTKPITFGHKQYVYYGNQFDLSFNFIKNILKENRPGLYRIINRMYENDGVISYFEIFKISGCLRNKTTSKVNTISQLIKILEDLKLAKKMCEYDSGTTYLVAYNMEESDAIYRMRENICELRLDSTFIPSFLIWLQKHNFLYNKNIVYRSKDRPAEGAVLNNLIWDAVGYTSTTGFCEYIGEVNDEKRTVIVLDFKVSNMYNIDDLHGFYDRIQVYRNSVTDKNSKRKILPIIVTNEISDEVKVEIKKLKMLLFNLGTVFGERIYEVIQDYKKMSFMDVEYNDFISKIEDILSILKESGQEENLGNLKGELFERLIDSVIRRIYRKDIIKLQHSVIFGGFNQESKKRERYEFDYLLETEDEFIIFELKGYKGTSFIRKGEFNEETQKPEKNTLKWFFSLTYPFAKKYIIAKEGLNPKPVRACYITTARFDSEALEVLEKINNSKDKPNDLDIYYDGTKLLNLLEKYNLHREIKVIKQYYRPVIENEYKYNHVNEFNSTF
ncbi:hypothetical protein QTI53_13420 [Clostridium perfringens]|nr:hypothetical protein [Clostridium perfringens]